MDGLLKTAATVLVLASTNRPEVLDTACTRAGRFDRKLQIGPPDLEGREQLFKKLLGKFKMQDDIDLVAPVMAKLTPGLAGADIGTVVNEAALRAAMLNRTGLTQEDLSWAADRGLSGIGKKDKISQAELNNTAIHESGHAVVSPFPPAWVRPVAASLMVNGLCQVAWFLPHAAKPVKITIINKGQFGGYNLVNEEKKIPTEAYYRDNICMFYGGRAAEEITLGTPSAGALMDLKMASSAAASMVKALGYGKRTGLLAVAEDDSASSSRLSETTLRIMEEEMTVILNAEYARAKAILTQHRAQLIELAELLLQKEVVHEADIEAVLGPKVSM
jgi:AFG3 family protein